MRNSVFFNLPFYLEIDGKSALFTECVYNGIHIIEHEGPLFISTILANRQKWMKATKRFDVAERRYLANPERFHKDWPILITLVEDKQVFVLNLKK
jgi:hypothetical protein